MTSYPARTSSQAESNPDTPPPTTRAVGVSAGREVTAGSSGSGPLSGSGPSGQWWAGRRDRG
ncbi:hypothetical protein ACFFX0_07665 [Citricoccus parietis]|uniref:Uncharacterized protein n=1 Tax=Citricoccus parietis TaxID=592307 RepID=A0ABV5FWM2_9MICC